MLHFVIVPALVFILIFVVFSKCFNYCFNGSYKCEISIDYQSREWAKSSDDVNCTSEIA